MEENKKFDKYFKRLIALSINIINEYSKLSVDIEKEKLIRDINKYQTIYSKTEQSEHIEIVKDVYEKYKFIFNKDIDDMDALKTSNIEFVYGDKKRNVKIKIFELYTFACELDSPSISVSKLINNNKMSTNKYEFLLILLQLLKSATNKSETFDDNIKQLKIKLNRKIKQQQIQAKNPIEGFIAPILGQIMPNYQEHIDLNKMISSVTNIFNDEKMKNLLSTMNGNVLENPGELLKTVLNTVATPEMAEKIKNEMEKKE